MPPETPPTPKATPTRTPAEVRTDEELLEVYRSGESAAFSTLIRRHHDDLLRFLFRLTGSRTTAEDAFQETFLQVHVSAGTFDATRRFKPWLFTIAANKARDAMRKNSRRRALDLSAPVSGPRGSGGGDGDDGQTFADLLEIDIPAPDDRMSAEERDAKVQEALNGLSDSLREILLLAYFQRFSYNQIADALGIPLGTVKSRLHSAVAGFARRWKAVTQETSDE